jgi:hypothetical protein
MNNYTIYKKGGGKMDIKPVGKTKTAGFQVGVGVRRTFPVTQEKAWNLITSNQGLALWLGKGTGIILEPGQGYKTETGISGQLE